MGSTVAAYDAQGNHRTGTPGDLASTDWLAGEARALGGAVQIEPFRFSRVDPRACFLATLERRVDGEPLFDATFTDESGVRGQVGPLGGGSEIGLTESEPSRLTDPGSESRRAVLSDVRRSRHKAVILITRGSRPGLCLLNAPAFGAPSGPPTLQVSSAETTWLRELAASRAEARLVVNVSRVAATAANVTASVAGSDPALAPVVVSTPRTGWWRCASERGGGLACWLEVLRAVAEATPKRDCHFVAFGGHEISWLGMRDYLSRRPDVIKRAHLWLHFGANVGAVGKTNMISASDDSLENWAAKALAAQRVAVDRRAERGSTPFGEAAFVHRGGGRYVAVVCDNEFFHHADDRWPDAVDVAAVAHYARAFAQAIRQAAAQST